MSSTRRFFLNLHLKCVFENLSFQPVFGLFGLKILKILKILGLKILFGLKFGLKIRSFRFK